MKKQIARSLVMILVLSLFVSLFAGVTVKADDFTIDPDAKGSITVHKFANVDGTQGNKGTGLTENVEGHPLAGVTFKLYKVVEGVAYYNGDNTTTYTNPGSYVTETNYIGDTDGKRVTDSKGECTFDDLPVGIYVLVEVSPTTEHTVVASMNPVFVSIPMVNTDDSTNNNNAAWMYNVHVYPKNQVKGAKLELLKEGKIGSKDATPLSVEFKLQWEKSPSVWEDVVIENYTTAQPAGNGNPSTVEFKTGADGKLNIDYLPSGANGTKYRLVEIKAPNGYIVNKDPIVFTVNTNGSITWDSTNTNTAVGENHSIAADNQTLNINMLNLQPTLKKEISKSNSFVGAHDEDFDLNDKIYYRITVDVPANIDELGTFVITDTADSNIKIDFDSFSVVNAGDEDVDYTISKLTDSSFTFEFKAVNGKYKSTAAGEEVTITYEGKLTGVTDSIATEGYQNKATLVYSKEIGEGAVTDSFTIVDNAVAYTHEYDITKSLDNYRISNGGFGTGVEFQLYDGSTLMSFVKIEDGKYRVARDEDSDTTNVLVTKGVNQVDPDDTTQGTLKILGLDDQAYTLKETRTIQGYNLLSDTVTIEPGTRKDVGTTWTTTASEFGTSTTLNLHVGPVAQYDDTIGAIASKEIINKQGFVLPETGSMGYLLFCGAGLILVGAGAMLMFSGKKRRIQ